MDVLLLLRTIIKSFSSSVMWNGLPLGNLTSQLLVNIYMNEFDQFVKRALKVKYYVRYADDFVFLSENKNYLIDLRPQLDKFLSEHLGLSMHPQKVFLQTLASGVDFLGWVNFMDHRVLRTTTKKRMLKKIEKNNTAATRAAYSALLKYGNIYKLSKKTNLINSGL